MLFDRYGHFDHASTAHTFSYDPVAVDDALLLGYMPTLWCVGRQIGRHGLDVIFLRRSNLNSYRRVLVLISTTKIFFYKTHRHHSALLKGTFASILLQTLHGLHAQTIVQGVRVLY